MRQKYHIPLHAARAQWDTFCEDMPSIGPDLGRTAPTTAGEAGLLRNLEAHLLALQAAHGIIYEVDLKDGSVRRDGALFQLIGLRPQEAPPTVNWWVHRVHREDRQRCQAAYGEVLADGERQSMRLEYRILHEDGTYRWVCDNACILRDSTGDPVRIVGLTFDITDRKEGEQNRQQVQQRLEALEHEQRSVATLMSDVALALTQSQELDELLQAVAASVVRHLDAAFARIWTLNEKENVLELKASAGCYTHLDGSHSRVRVGQFKIGSIAEQRLPHLTNDVLHDPRISDRDWARREGMVAFAGYPLLLEDRVLGVLALFAKKPLPPSVLEAMGSVARHISLGIERKRSEEAVHEADRLLSSVVDGAPVAIILLDPQGAVLRWNPAAERMFGWSEAEVRLQRLPNLVPEEQEGFARMLSDALQGRRSHIEKARRRSKSGICMDAACWTAPLYDVAGQVAAVMVVEVDVTERNELEEQLRRRQKMEALGRLAGGIAHDFNNLLTVILGYGQVMEENLEPSNPLFQNLQEISDAATRAASLTRQLLLFSRQDVSEKKLLNLNSVIAHLQRMLHRIIGEDIELTTALEPKIGTIKIDPAQLEQVIINLAVNARDAMPRGGKLTFATRNVVVDREYVQLRPEAKPGAYVLLSVSDTGCGMSKEVQQRIFEPFFTTKQAGEGTGLGLATTYGIVKQAGGWISVYSEVGYGTVFNIFLPRLDASVAAETADRTSWKTLRGTETILLVEDDDTLRALSHQILAQNGYKILEAHNGKEALAVAERHGEQIDLLLTDVVMPQMSGRELAERLLTSHPQMKVLYLSGYTDDAVVRYGVLQGETAFLQKPFTAAGLSKKVREVLDH